MTCLQAGTYNLSKRVFHALLHPYRGMACSAREEVIMHVAVTSSWAYE